MKVPVRKIAWVLVWIVFTFMISKYTCHMTYTIDSTLGNYVRQGMAIAESKVFYGGSLVCCGVWACSMKPPSANDFIEDGGCVNPREGLDCSCKQWDIVYPGFYTPDNNEENITIYVIPSKYGLELTP